MTGCEPCPICGHPIFDDDDEAHANLARLEPAVPPVDELARVSATVLAKLVAHDPHNTIDMAAAAGLAATERRALLYLAGRGPLPEAFRHDSARVPPPEDPGVSPYAPPVPTVHGETVTYDVDAHGSAG